MVSMMTKKEERREKEQKEKKEQKMELEHMKIKAQEREAAHKAEATEQN